MPESLAAHPCVFATFTAPSFGPVHTRVVSQGGTVARCRPRRKASFCPHGRRLSCGQRHKDTDACLGRPLCPDCYDYSAAVVWNAHAPELWRRTTIAIRRRLDKLAKAHGTRVKLSYAKVAEFQRRGLIHFHAVFRLDGHDPVHPERSVPPHPAFTAEVLAEVIQQVASTTWFATVSHPAKPRGWDITWGRPDRPARRPAHRRRRGYRHQGRVVPGQVRHQVNRARRCPAGRITAKNASIYADPGTYEGRLIAACLRLGAHPHEDFRALRRWAHMFGYRGHFATKSRRYSTTMRVLRAARRDWVRRQQPTARRESDGTVITSPTCDGLGGAGAPPATHSSPSPPLPAPGSSGVSPAKRWPSRHDRKKEMSAMDVQPARRPAGRRLVHHRGAGRDARGRPLDLAPLADRPAPARTTVRLPVLASDLVQRPRCAALARDPPD